MCEYYHPELAGCCYAQKNAPKVYCKGEKCNCELSNSTEPVNNEKSVIEIETKTEYYVTVSRDGYTKDNIDICNCYCKTIPEVVDVVYAYLSKTEKCNLNGISITPTKKVYYKKGLGHD